MYLCGLIGKRSIQMFTTLISISLLSFSTFAASDHDVKILTAEFAAMTEFKVDSKSDGVLMSLNINNVMFDFDLAENKRLTRELQNAPENAEFTLYRGTLRGAENSWARFSKDNGKVSGAYFDGKDLFFVSQPETVENELAGNIPQFRPADSLVVYNANDVKHSGVCALEGHSSNSDFNYQSYSEQLDDMTSSAAASVLQVSVVADLPFAGGTSASDQADAVAEMLTEMNIVDGIFSGQLGLEISVVSTDVFADHTAIPASMTDAEDMIYQYRTYVRNEASNPGISHLFTGKDMDGGTIGIAFVGAVCGSSAVGITQRFNTRTALVAAHEIGHNMGAPHDGDSGYACGAEGSTFLMNPRINGSNQFSDCSVSVMTPLLSRGCILDNDIAPIIDSTANLLAEVGEAYSYDNDNTVNAAGSGPITFALLDGPFGMTVSEDGLVSWMPTIDQVGINFVQISASNEFGSSSQSFEIVVQGPLLPYVNFNERTISSFGSNQDKSGLVNIELDGFAISLSGNRWKKIDFAYEITANTVIEFDFQSDGQGEIHGIGMDSDNTYQSTRTFSVYGTQDWGRQNFRYSGSGDVERFTIPIGEFYTGQVSYMYFVMDNDVANPDSHSQFSNILVYEREAGPLNFNEFEISPFGKNQNFAGFEEVLDDGATLRLEGNIWRKIPINKSINADSVLEFEFKSSSVGEIHGIGFNTKSTVDSGKTFQLLGTQNWANRDFTYTGNGEFQKFIIPIGEYYTGTFNWLFFAMDNDVENPTSESIFRNVIIR